MDTFLIVLVVMGGLVVAAIVIVAAARMARARRAQREREQQLRDRFGREYDRVVSIEGHREGQDVLEARLARYDHLDHRALSPAQREGHTETWRRLQFGFVDSPERSVREAENLVVNVMEARGYPTCDSAVRAAALSVDEPDLADAYRAAHRAYRHADFGDATVGQLHGAVLVYRELLEYLLDRPQREATTFDAEPPSDAKADRFATPHEDARARFEYAP